jgi:VCBS repeat-containing protein
MEPRLLPTTVTYHGGPLLANVQVESFFYGATWNSDPGLVQQAIEINGFLKTITNSPFMDQLGEYSKPGYDIDRGTAISGPVFASADPYEGIATDQQIQSALAASINAGAVVQPDKNTLYMVYLPRFVLNDIALQGALGYHSTFTDAAGATIYYAVIIDQIQFSSFFTIPGLNEFQQFTGVTSHELAESVTDPDTIAASGWYYQNLAGEVGDLCVGMFGTIDGYTVQMIWSNQQYLQTGNGCLLLSDPIFTASSITATAGSRFDGIVGTIADRDPTASISDYTVQINWGDNTGTTTGTLQSNGGLFDIIGSHTYGQRGTYTPLITVYDGSYTVPPVSGTATVKGQVPVANNVSYVTQSNSSLVINAGQGLLATASDAENDAMTAALVAAPTHGTVTVNADGSFTYNPNAGFRGQDTFTFQAVDQDGASNTVIATLQVTGPPPIVVNSSFATQTNSALSISGLGVLTGAAAPDGQPFTALLELNPLHGSVTLNSDGSFTYTPNRGFAGQDSFTFGAQNVDGISKPGTVTITVIPLLPVAVNNSYTALVNTPLQVGGLGVLTNATDAENNPLTAVLQTGPANGQLTLNAGGSFLYAPNPGFRGQDSFTYVAQDINGPSNIATATISVIGQVPTTGNFTFTTTTGIPLSVTAANGLLSQASDAENDPLTAMVQSQAGHGQVAVNADGSFSYAPVSGFIGTDSFTYVVQDRDGNSNPATVTLVVKARAIYATGADAGGPPEVKVFDALTGAVLFDFNAYDPHFLGGVRIAVADINGDGIPDIITAPGAGGGPDIRIFDGSSGAMIGEFLAYDPHITTGVFLAAGQVTAGANADIITAPDSGGGPDIRVFSGLQGNLVHEFLAYDYRFDGGVHIAVGNLDGSGVDNLITAPGAGGGPDVRVFDATTGTLVQEFLAYDFHFTGGVYVTAGDVSGTGVDSIITGPGFGGGPDVRVFNGLTGALVQEFLPFDSRFAGGVRVGTVNVNGQAEILAAAGPGGGPEVAIFGGSNAALLDGFFAFDPTFTGGVFVGGSS